MQKYGFDDARPVLERASARETAARVALGAVAQAFLRQVWRRGALPRRRHRPASAPTACCPGPDDLARIDADPVRCLDPATSAAMVAEVDDGRKDGDTLGGVVEVVVHGLPPGLGSHVHWDRRLDSRLAAALMGVQAIKGSRSATVRERPPPRLVAHDEIDLDRGRRLPRRTAGPAAPRAA